jgi:hypothetical protein
MTEPRNPLEVVEEALAAALAYIDESPCDPDITREQWTAWQRLEESSARAALALVSKMRADPVAWASQVQHEDGLWHWFRPARWTREQAERDIESMVGVFRVVALLPFPAPTDEPGGTNG